MVAPLSQNTFIGFSTEIFNSSSNLESHIPLHIPCTIALNFTSVLHPATIGCVLLHKVTRFLHIKVQDPNVDLGSIIDPAQSALVNTSISLFNPF